MNVRKLSLILAGLLLLSSACNRTPSPTPGASPSPSPSPTQPGSPLPSPTLSPISPLPTPQPAVEQPVRILPMMGPLTAANAELSGMAWHTDRLFLLPQYPSRFDDSLFWLSEDELRTAIRCGCGGPLDPHPIALHATGLDAIPGFEGFEALAFDGERVYVTIETKGRDGMMGALIPGTVSLMRNEIHLDVAARVPLPPQAPLNNMTDEALLVNESALLTLYEANGANVNPAPVAHQFAAETLEPQNALAFPNLEYRLTDATALDAEGRFWVLNYFWPGDNDQLHPIPDPLAAIHGEGPTHAQYETVERLIEYRLTDAAILRTVTPPIQLQLLDDDHSRNWEGIARLDDGFLLITDKHPETLLGYVPGLPE